MSSETAAGPSSLEMDYTRLTSHRPQLWTEAFQVYSFHEHMIVSVFNKNVLLNVLCSYPCTVRSLELVADIMEPDYLSVTVRVNGYCNDSYTVTLAFGTGPKTGGCKAGLNATSVTLAPGDTNRFSTYTDSLPLPANHTYCYLINGVPHAFIDAGPSPGPSGATVTLSDTLLMILLVAVALG